MVSVLITGANRGLGYEFTKQYAEEGATVYAACRDPAKAVALNALAKDYAGKVRVYTMDVGNDASVGAVAKELDGETIDILINNAGIGGNQGRDVPIDYPSWEEVMRINALAPHRVTSAFYEHLKRSNAPKAVALSSGAGCNTLHRGESFAYNSSKAALNNIMMGFAVKWKKDNIIAIALSPGWVRTDMGGPNGRLDPPESIRAMRATIANLTIADSGRHLEYQGNEMPW